MRRLLLLVCALCLALCRVNGRVSDDPTPETPICGLDGFQLDTLDQAAQWSMTIEANDCIVPTGYEESNITQCRVYFSICKVLSDTICPGHTNSSTCLVVTTNDGNQSVYSIGDYQNANEFEVTGGPDTVGFSALRRGDTIQSRLCNASFSTALSWACDNLHHWDPQTGDATAFITGIVGRSLDNCFLEVEFGYTGACYVTPTSSPEFCQLDPFDLVELSSNDYWFASVDPVLCYGDEATSCNIYFSFCRAVPPDVDGACYEAGVCQTGTDGDGNTFGYNMGKFNPQFTQFFENVDEIDGRGFHMDVMNGSQPDNGRCNSVHGIKSRVILTCNSSVEWKTNDLTGLIRVAYQEAIDPCQYIIFVPYAGACASPTPPPVVEAIVNYIGWIFIGIFLFVVVVYLAVGAGYQFLVKGERGLKVIPNYEFWAAFVMSVLTGCKFFLDIITCFKFDGRIKAPGTSSVDYDKI